MLMWYCLLSLADSNKRISEVLEEEFDDGGCLVEGCTYTTAINYQPQATMDDQSCLFESGEEVNCPDLDGDASVATSDLLIFLSAFGLICGP